MSRGRQDRTHRTLTPQDPVSSHRRESLVGWTGYTDPALLEENKKHMNAAQPQAVPRSVKLHPHGEQQGEESQGGNISCPGHFMRHSHRSWTNNCCVSIQARVTVISVLTRSHNIHHQRMTQGKQHRLPTHFYACCHQAIHIMVCLTPAHRALTVPIQVTGRSGTHLCWGQRRSHSLPAHRACCHQREGVPPGSRWRETDSGSGHWPTPASH